MAYIFDAFDEDKTVEDITTYVDTYNTEQELLKTVNFCPLCEIPDSYTLNGNRPIMQLNKVISDVQCENKLGPSAFIKFITKYYNDKTRPFLTNVLHWQNKTAQTLDRPEWLVHDVYIHFSEHVADPWLSRSEALRQTNSMLKRTANTCLTRDGPPNPNTVRTYVELTKLRETLIPKPKAEPLH